MSRFITNLFYKGEPLRPALRLSDGQELNLIGKTLSLRFDTSERFCIGWHELASGRSHPCPNSVNTDKKYDTCPACQRRTGFNPAFYHTTAVSPQQEARNAEPHHLYLVHMGGNHIKVGISWHRRGIKRLLDQGARAGLILETFPTALIARQYEAKIAQLNGIHETTPTRTKLTLLAQPFNEAAATDQLIATKQRAQEALAVSFSGNDTLLFDTSYTDSVVPHGNVIAQKDPVISGKVAAVIGDIVIAEYDGRHLALPLKQFLGYLIKITDGILPLDLEPEQMQLF